MNENKTYLFTLTITPVQSFISQARKTKDLFTGSEILSNLMKKSLKKFSKIERIFPQSDEFVSNKFVVKLKDKTEEDIEKIGKNLEKSINNDFINLIFKETQQCDSAFKNFFKVYWVAVELDDDYKKSYKKLEQNLGAIKNLRAFEQNLQPSGKDKCSICGERNWEKEDKGDKLCLICYTKRNCSKYDTSYPSTSKIALLDWLKDIDYGELKKLDDFDEQWLLEDKKEDKVKKFIKDNKLDISTQKKYYALIQFDMDDLGKKLSELDEEGQIKLSEKLGQFARKAKNIVDKQGKTIYAGGDDFLGFVNLEYLFVVIQEIKKAFIIENLTYSMGIVIAHYKEPLHIVLNRVRRVAKMAKKIDQKKNGLAISVLKHSGEMVESKIKNKIENIQNLNQIIQLVKDYFSDKFIINLELEFRSLVDKDNSLLVQKKMLQVELKRLIKKSLIDKEKKERVEELFNLLNSFIEHRNMSDFFNLLNIIRFMKRILK